MPYIFICTLLCGFFSNAAQQTNFDNLVDDMKNQIIFHVFEGASTPIQATQMAYALNQTCKSWQKHLNAHYSKIVDLFSSRFDISPSESALYLGFQSASFVIREQNKNKSARAVLKE